MADVRASIAGSPTRLTERQPATMRGWTFGMASAALFGISTPLSKILLPEISPVMLAGLLYLGAGLGLTIVGGFRRRPWPRFSKADFLRLTCIATVGGFIAPFLLLYGLTRVSGVAGSLMMNLESVFTIVLATWLFHERLSRWEWIGAVFVFSGAALVTYAPGVRLADLVGVLAIVAACLGWAVDNNLTQQISSYDPVAIVQVKGLTAGVGNVVLAFAVEQHFSSSGSLLAMALAMGFVCYGLSIVFDVYALRYLGAAREAGIFATAPFIGAASAIPILHERVTASLIGAALLMALGLVFFGVGKK
jgi:drug/metabolite transporter (DMT)-like permease